MHILLVEDMVIVAWMFRDALEQDGYRVSIARDGKEALEIESRDPADLLITDLNMPRMDGYELLTRMRSSRPGLPVIVVSGYTASISGLQQDRATVILSKPVSPGTVVNYAANLLQNANSAGSR